MGVNNFTEVLKNRVPGDYTFTYPLEALRNQTVSMDMSYLIFMMKSTAVKQVLSETVLSNNEPDLLRIDQLTTHKVIDRLTVFYRHGVEVICVFDSKHQDNLKEETKAKRRNNDTKADEKFAQARYQLLNTDPIFRTTQLTTEYEKAYKASQSKPSWEYVAHLRGILTGLGFPCTSPNEHQMMTGDAEALGAALALPGNDYCFGCVTVDSDYHVYGGQFAILDVDQQYKTIGDQRVLTHTIQIRSLPSILTQLGFTFDKFRDLCILLGTDFNNNIKGMGAIGSWKAIEQYGSIYNMSQYKDVSTLRYPEVLRKFSDSIRPIQLRQRTFDWNRFQENADLILKQEGLIHYKEIFLRFMPKGMNRTVQHQTYESGMVSGTEL